MLLRWQLLELDGMCFLWLLFLLQLVIFPFQKRMARDQRCHRPPKPQTPLLGTQRGKHEMKERKRSRDIGGRTVLVSPRIRGLISSLSSTDSIPSLSSRRTRTSTSTSRPLSSKYHTRSILPALFTRHGVIIVLLPFYSSTSNISCGGVLARMYSLTSVGINILVAPVFGDCVDAVVAVVDVVVVAVVGVVTSGVLVPDRCTDVWGTAPELLGVPVLCCCCCCVP